MFWIVILSAILVQLGGLSVLGDAFAVVWALFTIGIYLESDRRSDTREPSGRLMLLLHGALFAAALWWTWGAFIEAMQLCSQETVCQTLPNLLKSMRCELCCLLQRFSKYFLLNIIALSIVVWYTVELVAHARRYWHITSTRATRSK